MYKIDFTEQHMQILLFKFNMFSKTWERGGVQVKTNSNYFLARHHTVGTYNHAAMVNVYFLQIKSALIRIYIYNDS